MSRELRGSPPERIVQAPWIQVQPLQLTIHDGSAMLVTNREGWVDSDQDGLFDHDTRYLSYYHLTLNGMNPLFLTANQDLFNCASLSYTNHPFRSGTRTIDELALLLRISRVFDQGLHENFELTNYDREPLTCEFVLQLESSFDTVDEVRGLQRRPPRLTRAVYDGTTHTMTYSYCDTWFSRRLDYRILSADTYPRYTPNALLFVLTLDPQQTWRAETNIVLGGEPLGKFIDSVVTTPTGRPVHPVTLVEPDPPFRTSVAQRLRASEFALEQWTDGLAKLEASNPVVERAYNQSLNDLASLRLQKVDGDWYPAAGVPWYNCLFGRDALLTAYQGLLIGCPYPRAVLTRLAELQGTRVNLWNDEEPGKIPHELRVGQLSLMGKTPFNPFYGTVDASLLYVILLSESYRFSGDRQLLERFRGPMEGCLRWAAEYGDIDGDGFIEYWMRSPTDYHNQGWKDAGDAVVYPDGRIVPDPIAIVEVQGYYYDALCRASEIYRILGEAAHADAAERHAADLQARFIAQFWLADEQFYAYGLDPDKRPIRSIASNPGQLLWSRIVPPAHAAAIATRLMADDMFCGWGVRTLSSQNGAYDPVAYQRGSIWPQDNAIIALGLKRYGHHVETNRIAEGIFSASGCFALGRLPELWVGVDRGETHWPVLYPHANVPQAWAAGSIALLLRAILGLEPDIARRCLRARPTLPEWLEQITLRRLPFAGGTLDLKFSRDGSGSHCDVLACSGTIQVEADEEVGS